MQSRALGQEVLGCAQHYPAPVAHMARYRMGGMAERPGLGSKEILTLGNHPADCWAAAGQGGPLHGVAWKHQSWGLGSPWQTRVGEVGGQSRIALEPQPRSALPVSLRQATLQGAPLPLSCFAAVFANSGAPGSARRARNPLQRAS